MSHARGRGARLGPTFFCALLSLTANTLAADVQIVVHNSGIAVDAVDTSVREILEALVANDLLVVESALALDDVVTLHTQPEPLAILLRRMLRQYSYELVDAHMSSSTPHLTVFSADPITNLAWRAEGAPRSTVIDQALLDLSSLDPNVREEAVLTLSDTGDRDVAVYFASSLEDPDIGVREAARAAIEDMDTTDFIGFDRLTEQETDE